MNKGELVAKTAEKAAVTKQQADMILNAAMESIIGAVSHGERVTLAGFGSFAARDRKQRLCRHPRTGESLLIPAKTVPAFSAGKLFKYKVATSLHVLRIRRGTASPQSKQSTKAEKPVKGTGKKQGTALKKRIKSITGGVMGLWK
jgi:DNA-binding protein HU-beta